jgi:hypothetical protein
MGMHAYNHSYLGVESRMLIIWGCLVKSMRSFQKNEKQELKAWLKGKSSCLQSMRSCIQAPVLQKKKKVTLVLQECPTDININAN